MRDHSRTPITVAYARDGHALQGGSSGLRVCSVGAGKIGTTETIGLLGTIARIALTRAIQITSIAASTSPIAGPDR